MDEDQFNNYEESQQMGPKNIAEMQKIFMTPKSIINGSKPTQQDIEETKKLKENLDQEFNYNENSESQNFKRQKIDEVRQIIKEWVKIIAKQLFGSDEIALEKADGDLLVFGSQELNVNCQGSDVDTVCIVPKYINREEHFFYQLFQILKNREGMENLYKIQDALVPLIKFTYFGIQFDIIFAKVDLDYYTDKIDLTSNRILHNMDEKSIRSLNGYRVAKYLQSTMKNNYENFQIALKLIKLWAKNRGIYSNVIGYLSGIGWTILVAKICQMYPEYSANRLLERFFFIYSKWRWQEIPVLIEEIQNDPENPKSILEQWSEQKDKNVMMIITPCFPCMNCAHNVSITTLRVMIREFRIGFIKVKQILESRLEYKDLFKTVQFFKQYKHFLEIRILASTLDEYNHWKGHIEIRLKKLTKLFEEQKFFQNLQLCPYPYPQDLQAEKNFPYISAYYYGIQLIQNPQQDPSQEYVVDIQPPISQFLSTTENSYCYKDPHSQHEISIRHLTNSQILTILDSQKRPQKQKP